MASGLLHHAFPGLGKDHPTPERRGLQRSGGELLRTAPRRGFGRPSFSRAKRVDQSSKIAAGTASSARPIFRARRASSVLPVRIRSSGGNEADDPRQPRASAPGWKDAEAHFGQPDLRLLRVGHQAIVAGQGELRPSSETGAVDRGDRRVRKMGELLEERLHALDAGAHVLGADLRELLDVRARDEDVGFAAADEEAPDASLAGQAHEDVGELLEDRGRELVDLLAGQIEGQSREAVVLDLELEGAHICSSRSRGSRELPTQSPRPGRRRCTSSPGRTGVPRRFISFGASSRAGSPRSRRDVRARSRRR